MLHGTDTDYPNNNTIEHSCSPQGRHAVLLLGIFSIFQEKETRQAHRVLLHESSEVCPLQAYIQLHAPDKVQLCKIVYTFVLGTSAGTDELVSTDILRHRVTGHPALHNEHDVTVLAVNENMNDNKTLAWFVHANSLVRKSTFDYVAKMDSDTMMRYDLLVNFMKKYLPSAPLVGRDVRKRYGGILLEYFQCGEGVHCRALRGRAYMSGQFYFVSTDLSAFVASSRVDHARLQVGYEDFDFGSWVFAHSEPINLVVISPQVFWIHNSDTKNISKWPLISSNYSSLPERIIST